MNLDEVHNESVSLFKGHAEECKHISSQLLDTHIPEILQEANLTEDVMVRQTCRKFAQDCLSVYRFYTRENYDKEGTMASLCRTLRWRAQPDEAESYGIEFLINHSFARATETLCPDFAEKPVIFFHEDVYDKFGRAAAILQFRNVVKSADRSTLQLRRHLCLSLELARRCIAHRLEESRSSEFQMVLIVDLEGASISNIEYDVLPFLVEMTRMHFPRLVGRIYIANYSWYHSGMWAVSKQFLPQTLIQRILFLSKEQLIESFGADHLLKAHGGSIDYTFSLHNNGPIGNLGRTPVPDLRDRQTGELSRSASQQSFDTSWDALHARHGSQPATPYVDFPSPSGDGSSLTRSNLDRAFDGQLKRRRNISHLAMSSTPIMHTPNDSSPGTPRVTRARTESNNTESEHEPASPSPQTAWQSFSSYAKGLYDNVLLYSEEVFPGSQEPIEDSIMLENVQPRTSVPLPRFSSGNPYYGYKSVVPTQGIQVPHPQDRRKRDLIATLSYLTALRIVQIHQSVSATLNHIPHLPQNAAISWIVTLLTYLRSVTVESLILLPDILNRVTKPARSLLRLHGRDYRVLLTAVLLLSCRSLNDRDAVAALT